MNAIGNSVFTPMDNRCDFVFLFDVKDGNPNGNPDAGNMPRVDPDTGIGLVTDVCLKRKIRNYVELIKNRDGGTNNRIYIREGAVLNTVNREAYDKLPDVEFKAKKLGSPKCTDWMCRNFYDIRTFGAVMANEVNCGQVRGPVQLTFARSVDPIESMEVAITRVAVTNQKDADKERTIGRKHIVPYGLYRAHGFISAPLARKTGFSSDDMALLVEALMNMFEHDRSAAKGLMTSRALYLFKHDSLLGNAHADALFERIGIRRRNPEIEPRAYNDYEIIVSDEPLPEGVTMIVYGPDSD